MSPQSRAEKVRQELRAPSAAGVAGILFAVFFMGSLLLTRAPQDATSESFVEWYSSGIRSTLVLVGVYAIPFAGIAFLWFIGVIRDRIGSREDRFFATVFLGSGLLFVSMLFAAAASGTAIALRMDALGSVTVPERRRPGVRACPHASVLVRVCGARRRRVRVRDIDDRLADRIHAKVGSRGRVRGRSSAAAEHSLLPVGDHALSAVGSVVERSHPLHGESRRAG